MIATITRREPSQSPIARSVATPVANTITETAVPDQPIARNAGA
jgi:hypothetical protein